MTGRLLGLLAALTLVAVTACAPRTPGGPSDAPPEVHIAYYLWYGTPAIDGDYHHWTHPVLDGGNVATGEVAVAPDDIGANFWPEAGLYSSHDPATVDRHMAEIVSTGVDVVVC